MAKKEKAPKEPKPKKEKKPKEPKPKKEKKPKPPKPPKQPKPKKEKKAPSTEEGGEEKKGGGKKKLLLILIPVVVLIAAAAALLLTGVIGGKGGDADPVEATEESEGEEGKESADEESVDGQSAEGETPEDGEGGESSGGIDLDQYELPPPPVLPPQPALTTAEIGTFIESLSPAVLGLEGEDMSGYEVFPSEGVSYIRDPDTGANLTCTRIQIFSTGEVSGTNDIEGIYLLTRGGQRRLFRHVAETDTWEELSLS